MDIVSSSITIFIISIETIDNHQVSLWLVWCGCGVECVSGGGG